MTLQEIHEATGCSKSRLSLIENGKRDPSFDTLRRIVQTMRFTMADLWQAHELLKELTVAERPRGGSSPSPGDGTLPPDDRWPPEEAHKAALGLAQEVGRSVAHVVLSFMELQAGGWSHQ